MAHLNNITLINLEGLKTITAYVRVRVMHGGRIKQWGYWKGFESV